MSNLYPLKFRPHLKSVLWGGTRILDFKKISSSSNNIGESWEISGIEGHESVIENGELKGLNIKTLLELYGREVMGEKIYSIHGNKFPLLIKFLDANQDLSIQVHPNDELSMALHGNCGKTELWYIIDSNAGAHIYSGFSKQISKEDLIKHLENSTITDVIAKFSPKYRDIFYLPAGRIHSIGAGCLLVEIQQTSDITYRLYDYNRIDANGKKREIHIDLAKEAVDLNLYDDYIDHVDICLNKEQIIKCSPYFTATILNITEPFHLDVAKFNSFKILIVTKGIGTLTDSNGNNCDICQGETILIAASTDFVDINPKSEMEIITSYIQL